MNTMRAAENLQQHRFCWRHEARVVHKKRRPIERKVQIQVLVRRTELRDPGRRWVDEGLQFPLLQSIGNCFDRRWVGDGRAYITEDGRINAVSESRWAGVGEGADPVVGHLLVRLQNERVTLSCEYCDRVHSEGLDVLAIDLDNYLHKMFDNRLVNDNVL